MLHEQRFFFLASKAIVFALSCVYCRSLHTGYLTNVINTTFGGAAGDTLACLVHLHAVPESCLLLPSGTVTGIAPIGLTRRARLPLVCATTLGVVGCDLQLERGALLLALCRLSNDTWWCPRATWHGKGKGNALPSDYVPPGGARTNMRDAITLGGSLSGSPALNADGLWPTARRGEP